MHATVNHNKLPKRGRFTINKEKLLSFQKQNEETSVYKMYCIPSFSFSLAHGAFKQSTASRLDHAIIVWLCLALPSKNVLPANLSDTL